MEFTYYSDTKRHLVCVPYSIENLHKMAEELEIPAHFFHKKSKKTGKLHPHYDIPVRRVKEIQPKTTVISQREIYKIIQDALKKV